MQREKLSIFFFKSFLLLFFSCFALFAPAAYAADLSIVPAAGSLAIKKSFTVDFILSKNTSPINAVSGEIAFPADILSVSSVSKVGSIMKMWPDEPHYSNAVGSIQFEGVVLNPGFSGGSGNILSVTFVPKKVGNANIVYTAGSILANDGEGTNVLGSMEDAHFVITSTGDDSAAPAERLSVEKVSSIAPVISSATHPDQTKWYSASQASFSWDIPAGVTAVRLLSDNRPRSTPTRLYSPVIASKTIDVDSDGVHYLHVQFKGTNGWGPVSHFRYQVDRTPPEPFSVIFSSGPTSTNPIFTAIFSAHDSLSGINRYEIRVDNGKFIQDDKNITSATSFYTLPKQEFGKHIVSVKAIDGAENNFISPADFTVIGLNPPVLSYFSKNLSDGDDLEVMGVGPAKTLISVFLVSRGRLNNEEDDNTVIAKTARSNETGNFSIRLSPGLPAGSYAISAQAVDDHGVKSAVTEPVAFIVSKRMPALNLILLGGALLIISIFSYWFILKKKIFSSRRVPSESLLRANAALQGSFLDTEGDVRENIRLLHKAGRARDLTKEEGVILRLLEGHLDVLARRGAKMRRKK